MKKDFQLVVWCSLIVDIMTKSQLVVFIIIQTSIHEKIYVLDMYIIVPEKLIHFIAHHFVN